MQKENKVLSTKKILNPSLRPARFQNSVASPSGAASAFDRGAGYVPLRNNKSVFQQDIEYVDLYYGDWMCRKGIDIPIHDMLRQGHTYSTLDPDQQKLYDRSMEKLKLNDHIRRALTLERLLGGSAILLGVDDGQEASEPLQLQNIQKGGLTFLNVINRERISRIQIDTDPLSPFYGKPNQYWINGTTVHRSRLIIFDGQPLFPVADGILAPRNLHRNDGFGVPILSTMYAELMRSAGSKQAVFHLINMASIFILKGDIQALLETSQGEEALNVMENMVNNISIYKMGIVGSNPMDPTTIETLSATFAGVPDVMKTFANFVSAGFDVPITRMMAEAPGGLNSNGKGDSDNYSRMIESKRTHTLVPQLHQLFSVASRSVFGPDVIDDEDVEIIFESDDAIGDTEKAQIDTTNATTLSTLVAAGILTTEEAYARGIELKLYPDQNSEQKAIDGAGNPDALRKRIASSLSNLPNANNQ